MARPIGGPVPLAGLLVLAMIFTACRPASRPLATTTTISPQPSTTTLPGPAPALRVALVGPVALDNWWAAHDADGTLMDRAAWIGANPSLFDLGPPGVSLAPDMADGVALPVPDGDRWVIRQRLVTDRIWSDGSPVTAHDLVFYVEAVRSLRLGGVHAERVPEEVVEVVAEDDHTVRIVFDGVPGPSLWPGVIGLAPFVPVRYWRPLLETTGHDLLTLEGTAPPRTGGPGPAWLAAQGRRAAYRLLLDGEVDYVYDPEGIAGLDAELIAELEIDPGVDLVTSEMETVHALAFNLRKPPFSDPAFRLAVATVVDREEMAGRVGGVAAYGFIHPDLSGHGPAARRPGWLDGDPLDTGARYESAIGTLAVAGYRWAVAPTVVRDTAGRFTAVTPGLGMVMPDGRPIPELEVLAPGNDTHRVAAAEAVTASIGLLGAPVVVSRVEPEALRATVLPPLTRERALAWDMAVLAWRGTWPADPGSRLVHLFHSSEDSHLGGGTNVGGYASATFDALADRFRATTDRERAADLLRRMELAVADDVPQVVLYRTTITEAHRSGLGFLSLPGGLHAHPWSWPRP